MKKTLLVFALPFVATACAISPTPLTEEDIRTSSAMRMETLTMGQEAVTEKISLYEAMARAIKYNLDYKVKSREKALRSRELKQARYDMLPQVAISTGYVDRNNYSGASSSAITDEVTLGAQSLVASSSSQREVTTDEFSYSWDILDFGLSYVRAQQKSDDLLIAKEQRRKVVNSIIEDVRTAYWRAVSAERLISELTALESDINGALASSQAAYKRRNTEPLSALTYQRELLKIKEEILELHKELGVAKQQLAALMNINPSTKYELVMPNRDESNLAFTPNAEKMVETAMYYRPELREMAYKSRINEKEATAALLELLPGIRAYGGFNYDSNEFLFNNYWQNWGARASWNVMEAFRYPARKKTVKAQQALLKEQTLALSMAIITQVHVSIARFEVAQRNVENSRQYHNVQSRILDQIDAGYKSKRVSKQTVIREKMNQIIAEAKYDIALADLQNAYANIHASMGLQPYSDDVTGEENITELASKLQMHWESRGDKIASETPLTQLSMK